MTTNIIRLDGLPVAPAVARDYVKLKAAHDAAFPNDPLRITSGYRTRSEQAAIFTARYRRGAHSPWGDYRVYQGATWGRISAAGPVASPDVGSNHTRGFALDVNLPPAGSARHNWFLANGGQWGFNWTEGRSIAEWWHVCWRVGIFPGAGAPDPWEGRGAPDPVYASDPGMPLGGSNEGDEELKDDERRALFALRDQIGGSEKRTESLRVQVDRLEKEIAAIKSTSGDTRRVIGSTVQRAKDGDTLGVRLDKLTKTVQAIAYAVVRPSKRRPVRESLDVIQKHLSGERPIQKGD